MKMMECFCLLPGIVFAGMYGNKNGTTISLFIGCFGNWSSLKQFAWEEEGGQE